MINELTFYQIEELPYPPEDRRFYTGEPKPEARARGWRIHRDILGAIE